jgi:amino acid transporter
VCAAQVREPGKKFPRALAIGVVLVVCTYLIPLLIGVGVMGDTSEGSWELGYYGHVAQMVGGSWLAWAMILSAAVSQIGQFEAEMSSDSYQVCSRLTLCA